IGWRGYLHHENYYPWNHAFCGDIDICGFKRPQSYYRDVLWGEGDQLSIFVKPPIPSFPEKEDRKSWSKWHWHDHVASWNWKGYEKQPLEVYVYSGHEKVELFLNGKSLGSKKSGLENEFITSWNVPYKKGELKVVATTMDGKSVIKTLKTARKPSEIKLKADKKELVANGQDLCFITVELIDKRGLRHPETNNLIEFELEGPGEILAVGSSNPMSTESFKQPKRKAYKGRCLVVVKAGKTQGSITLTAKSKGLKKTSMILTTKRIGND
ncbi:MAG: DUF4982 domain-containing protein, partial [Draconibacterium sp.]|nr:DUF4982 domain-containing protein [Draconibacterium sp.]